MTEAAVLRGSGPGGDHMDGQLWCRIVSALENKIIINNDRKPEPAGSPGTISAVVRGEARRKCMCLRNKEGGTDFYRLGLVGAALVGAHMLGLFSRWELKAAASDSDRPAAFGRAADDWVFFVLWAASDARTRMTSFTCLSRDSLFAGETPESLPTLEMRRMCLGNDSGVHQAERIWAPSVILQWLPFHLPEKEGNNKTKPLFVDGNS